MEYRLTKWGQALCPALDGLLKWTELRERMSEKTERPSRDLKEADITRGSRVQFVPPCLRAQSGSLTWNSDPKIPHRQIFGAYSVSKTALNAVTFAFDMALESTSIKVNAACPGFTATDLNNFQGTRTVEQAAREPVRLALLDANGPTGTFSNEDGPLPW